MEGVSSEERYGMMIITTRMWEIRMGKRDVLYEDKYQSLFVTCKFIHNFVREL